MSGDAKRARVTRDMGIVTILWSDAYIFVPDGVGTPHR